MKDSKSLDFEKKIKDILWNCMNNINEFSNNIEIKNNYNDHHKLFELSMIFIILFSALTVGARTYKQLEPYQDFLSYLDIFITVIF